MGAGIGAGLGLLLGAVSGYAGEKLQKKHAAEANEASILHDIAVKHPEAFAASPDMQKTFKKHFGDDSLQMIMGVGKIASDAAKTGGALFHRGAQPQPSAASQMIAPSSPGGFQGPVPAGLGAGVATSGMPTSQDPAVAAARQYATDGASGASPNLHPAVTAIWDDATALREQLDKADDFMSSPAYGYLDEGHRKVIDKNYALFADRLKQLESEARQEKRETDPGYAARKGAAKAAEETTERPAKIATKTAEEEAGLAVKTSPKAIAGETSLARSKKKAELEESAAAPKTPREIEAERKTVEAESKTLYDEGAKILSSTASSTTAVKKMGPEVDNYNDRLREFYKRNPTFPKRGFLVFRPPEHIFGDATVERAPTATHKDGTKYYWDGEKWEKE